MYRSGKEYDAIEDMIASIYIDYDIHTFPIDEREICKKLGVVLVPYSSFMAEDRWLLKKKSPHGFFVKGTKENPPTVFYNDGIESKGAIRFTIFHELKHFICEDDDDSEDDLAEHFARFFMCPTPYLMLRGINKPSEIVNFSNVSITAARHVSENIINRKRRYGMKLFDHEYLLLLHLDPGLLQSNECGNKYK